MIPGPLMLAGMLMGSHGPCRSPDATSEALLKELAKLTTDGGSRPVWRTTNVTVPDFRAAEAELVQDDSMCERASVAYRNAVRGSSAGAVHLVRLGEAYAVLDPSYYGPLPGTWTVLLLDPQMRAVGVL